MRKFILAAGLILAQSASAEAPEEFWSGVLLASNTNNSGAYQVVDRGNDAVPTELVERTIDRTLGEVSRNLDWELDLVLDTMSDLDK